MKLLRAAGILVVSRSDASMLLNLRSELCDNPLTWATFGGGCNVGESEVDAAYREMYEEFKVDLSTHKLKQIHRGTNKVAADFAVDFTTFLCTVNHPFTGIIDKESAGYGWFTALPSKCLPNFEKTMRRIQIDKILAGIK